VFFYENIPINLTLLTQENPNDPYSPMVGISDAFIKSGMLHEYHKTNVDIGKIINSGLYFIM